MDEGGNEFNIILSHHYSRDVKAFSDTREEEEVLKGVELSHKQLWRIKLHKRRKWASAGGGFV